jgi:hypothetical protein
MLKQPDFGKIEMLKKEANKITGGLISSRQDA